MHCPESLGASLIQINMDLDANHDYYFSSELYIYFDIFLNFYSNICKVIRIFF